MFCPAHSRAVRWGGQRVIKVASASGRSTRLAHEYATAGESRMVCTTWSRISGARRSR